jgi:hypothetical protein
MASRVVLSCDTTRHRATVTCRREPDLRQVVVEATRIIEDQREESEAGSVYLFQRTTTWLTSSLLHRSCPVRVIWSDVAIAPSGVSVDYAVSSRRYRRGVSAARYSRLRNNRGQGWRSGPNLNDPSAAGRERVRTAPQRQHRSLCL